jgi:hypothetical protein
MTLLRSLSLLCAAVLAIGCGDSTSPTFSPGTYVASATSASSTQGALSFTTTEDGLTTDWLAEGASITISLHANGTTTGRLFIPGLGSEENPDDGADFDADLAGTWSQTGDIIHLSHSADTFLRDMPFEVSSGTLVGDRTFGSVRVRVTLVRVGE